MGASLCVWGFSTVAPWFLLPDLPFLSIVYAGMFIQGPLGFLCALGPALIREVTSSGPPWSIFLGSMAIYLASNGISRRFMLRDEYSLLAAVSSLMAVESLTIVVLLKLAGAQSFGVFWGAQEAVRIAWTSLIAIPLFMHLSSRWRKVKD